MVCARITRATAEKADRILYVTDAGQASHFAQVGCSTTPACLVVIGESDRCALYRLRASMIRSMQVFQVVKKANFVPENVQLK